MLLRISAYNSIFFQKCKFLSNFHQVEHTLSKRYTINRFFIYNYKLFIMYRDFTLIHNRSVVSECTTLSHFVLSNNNILCILCFSMIPVFSFSFFTDSNFLSTPNRAFYERVRPPSSAPTNIFKERNVQLFEIIHLNHSSGTSTLKAF